MDFNEALNVIGAGCFGVLLGWYTYYVNRYRKEDVKLEDLVTLVGVLGGGSIMALFPQGSTLFGAYGIGLAIGFFGYFLVLVVLVRRSENFNLDWFLDGRRKKPELPYEIPGEHDAERPSVQRSRQRPMEDIK